MEGRTPSSTQGVPRVNMVFLRTLLWHCSPEEGVPGPTRARVIAFRVR
jgi:hypothetical protein